MRKPSQSQDNFLVSSILGVRSTLVKSINFVSPSPLVDRARVWLCDNGKSQQAKPVIEDADRGQNKNLDIFVKLADDPILNQDEPATSNKETRKVSDLCEGATNLRLRNKLFYDNISNLLRFCRNSVQSGSG